MRDITFEDIKKANETINTTDIKGKEYAEVNQRVKAFRMVYPTGFIRTYLSRYDEGVCVIKCEVGFYDDNGLPRIIGEGSAREEKTASYINKTSFLENCETSAVGRALGFAGFGIDTSICSADELQNAIEAQNTTETPKAEPIKDEPKQEDNATIKTLRNKLSAMVREIIKLTGKTKEEVCDYLFEKCHIENATTSEDYLNLIAYADIVITDNHEGQD